MSVADDIRRTDADGILTLIFSRDRKLNAVSDDMLDVMGVAGREKRDEDRGHVVASCS